MQNTLHNTFPVPHNVFDDEKFKGYKANTKLAYVWLLKLHNRLAKAENEGWFFHSGEKIAQEAGMDIKTFWSAKKQLKADGYIEDRPGIYNPEKNTRHAFWYKVNGFHNGEKPSEISKENQQADSQKQGIITIKALKRKFASKGEDIFAWAIESGLLERLSESEGRVIATDGQIMVAVGKAYAEIFDELTKFLLNGKL